MGVALLFLILTIGFLVTEKKNGVELRTQGADLSVIIPYDGEYGEVTKELFLSMLLRSTRLLALGPACLTCNPL